MLLQVFKMIYIIITASINPKPSYSTYHIIDPIHRKKRYVESISHLLTLLKDAQIQPTEIKPIIVENNGQRQTYLDDLGCDVLYTHNNFIDFPHKGGCEMADIKEVISKYNIMDDDIVIKLTGRYKMMDLSFINLIKNNDHDAFVKFFNVCTLEFVKNDCVLGMFAVKSKLLKEFNYNPNHNCTKSPECQFAEYIRIRSTKLMEIEYLNMECCLPFELRPFIV